MEKKLDFEPYITTIKKVPSYIISILPQQLKKLRRNGLNLSQLKSFSLIVRPLLVIGVLVFSLLLASYPSPEKLQATFSIPDQSLFVKSHRTNMVPPPLRIVEGSVLQGNRSPSVIQPQTLGAASQEADEIQQYVVKKGDTVSSIAGQFGLEPETILGANHLGWNSTLQPGDELIILPVDGMLYSVKKGDSISSIAHTYDVDSKEIVDYNDLESETSIYAGDNLILPGGEPPTTVAAAEQTPIGKNSLGYPCQGVITQSLSGITHNPTMQAVDIANNCGSRVVAAAGGIVKRAGYAGMLGKRVTIEHDNGVVTLYGHLNQINVVPGQEVHRAQIIGAMGNTGYTVGRSGCHLHYATPGAYNPLGSYPLKSSVSW